ncbi:uncharacterized protein MYCFIDRAFT_36447 [Pseudocercospora fijiensis CIRAD86]|uniref:L-serine ammonia-lyase n=1 Tax=Pseudocercospora fijiensis (strain CIRAD86) TaxID=383855 RepID=M3AZW1_PSEFD|nr:uncharacterized protein MYCFIDRAFT_36447 [Pseudocercospora fijiensis CIRAD86]EME82712.1 hypothetical protein MYCFIDRAFT_36447 [Pseudocercospora fijiensis CIRAD86]
MAKAVSTKNPWIETPLIWSRTLSEAAGCRIYLKLENVQPSGSFKSRGVGNYLKSHLSAAPTDDSKANAIATNGVSAKPHFFCSSGGNAGLACVHAAVTLGCPATIVVPMSTSDYMIGKLRAAGATEVIQNGSSWVDADTFLREEALPAAKARRENAVYVPPFDAPEIWTGNSTIVDEIARQMSKELRLPDAIVCSVGGGGLFSGIMQGLDNYAALSSSTKVLAVETKGADSLAQSIEKGEHITLPAITSIATTLGARKVAKRAYDYASDKSRVTTAVLSDAEAVEACKRFADDERILVEPSCGVALATAYSGKLRQLLPHHLKPSSQVVIVVCGGCGLSLEILANYIKQVLE